MEALIYKNRVVELSENRFDVAGELRWESCPEDCMPGWLFNNDSFSKPIVDSELTYIEKRREAYPSLQEQADMAYWDRQNGTTTLDDAITAVKEQYPKG